MLAVCEVDGFDVSTGVIRNGVMLAFTRYAIDYLD